MSIIPKKNERLDLYQGSTFDETWTFYEDDEVTLMDLTGWSAGMKVRATYDGPALLTLTSAVFAPPAADGIVMGDALGTTRIYARDETMALLSHAGFTATTETDGSTTYTGVWDFELQNPAGERSRYVMGPVVFWREATY